MITIPAPEPSSLRRGFFRIKDDVAVWPGPYRPEPSRGPLCWHCWRTCGYIRSLTGCTDHREAL